MAEQNEISDELNVDEAEQQITSEDEIADAEKQQLIEKNTLLFRRIKAVFGTLGLFVGYFILPLIFNTIFSQDTLANNGTVKLLASSLGFFVYFFFLIRYYIRRSDVTNEDLSDIIKVRPRQLKLKPSLICVLLGISLNLFLGALIALIPFPEAFIQDYSASSGALVYNDSMVLSVLYIVFIAPITEELMFRGFIFHRMNSAFPIKVTVCVVSLLFALPHINILWIIVAVINGLIFTFVRVKYDNLCYSIILHSCYNLVAVPMILLLGTQIYTLLFDNVFAEIAYLILGGMSIFLCIRWLMKKRDDSPVELSYNIK